MEVGVGDDDFAGFGVGDEACGHVEGVADAAEVGAAKGGHGDDLDVAHGHADVDAFGGLDLVDLALPFVGDGGADVEEAAGAVEGVADVVVFGVGEAVEGDDFVSDELVEHAAGVEDELAGFGVEAGEGLADDLVVGGVADVAGEVGEVGAEDDGVGVVAGGEDGAFVEFVVGAEVAEFPEAEVPEEGGLDVVAFPVFLEGVAASGFVEGDFEFDDVGGGEGVDFEVEVAGDEGEEVGFVPDFEFEAGLEAGVELGVELFPVGVEVGVEDEDDAGGGFEGAGFGAVFAGEVGDEALGGVAVFDFEVVGEGVGELDFDVGEGGFVVGVGGEGDFLGDVDLFGLELVLFEVDEAAEAGADFFEEGAQFGVEGFFLGVCVGFGGHGCGGRVLAGDGEGDGGAFVDFGFDPHAAAVFFGDVVGFGEAVAVAVGFVGGGVGGAVAGFDDFGDFFGGDAAAGVGYGEGELGAVVDEGDGDGAAGGGVFAGVGGEVADGVLEDFGHEDVGAFDALEVEGDEVVVFGFFLGGEGDAVAALAVLFDGAEDVEEALFELFDGEGFEASVVLAAGEHFEDADVEDFEDGVDDLLGFVDEGVVAGVDALGGEDVGDVAEDEFAVVADLLDGGEGLSGGVEALVDGVAGLEAAFEAVGVFEAGADDFDVAHEDAEDVADGVHFEFGSFIVGEGVGEVDFLLHGGG